MKISDEVIYIAASISKCTKWFFSHPRKKCPNVTAGSIMIKNVLKYTILHEMNLFVFLVISIRTDSSRSKLFWCWANHFRWANISDIVYIDVCPPLHVADDGTHFFAARNIARVSTRQNENIFTIVSVQFILHYRTLYWLIKKHFGWVICCFSHTPQFWSDKEFCRFTKPYKRQKDKTSDILLHISRADYLWSRQLKKSQYFNIDRTFEQYSWVWMTCTIRVATCWKAQDERLTNWPPLCPERS